MGAVQAKPVWHYYIICSQENKILEKCFFFALCVFHKLNVSIHVLSALIWSLEKLLSLFRKNKYEEKHAPNFKQKQQQYSNNLMI